MRPALAAILIAVLPSACSDFPRDPAGTLDRVRASETIRLGMVEGAAPDPAAERVLARLSEKTGARIERMPGHGEELLEGLELGEYDLVYGHFADASPWAVQVHFGTPPGGPDKPPKSVSLPRFAFRMGENGWITAVEGAAQ